MMGYIKKYWFLSALMGVCLLTLLDGTGLLSSSGDWLKKHNAPDMVIVLIFLLSGFALSPDQLRTGLKDIKGIMLAAVNIFILSPLLAALFGLIPLNKGIIIGLFLVSVMPSTLSSGVVMTAAAGGSAAHALVTTVVANTLSVFTIPYALGFLLITVGESVSVTIDKAAIMLKIALLVILPLAIGMLLKHYIAALYERIGPKVNLMNQCLILFIVWIAFSQTRSMLMNSGVTLGLITAIVFTYHGLLLISGWFLIRTAGRDKGKRESILFMGAQKTLPLSIILQVTLFPQYPIALLVCVLHHIVHLMMDGYLVERMRRIQAR